MCRNIKTLYNFAPPATEKEIRDAALQFVRKISGINTPSEVNTRAFTQAVDQVSRDAQLLLGSLVTTAAPKNRDIEAARRRERTARRFGGSI